MTSRAVELKAALLGLFLALPRPAVCADAAPAGAYFPEGGGRWEQLQSADREAAKTDLPPLERARVLRERARVRSRLGDEAGAETDLRRALDLVPGDAQAALRLAETIRDRPEEALVFSRRAGAHRLEGEILLDLGDRAGARAAVERALEAAPDDLDSLQAMVRVLGDRKAQAAVYAARAARAAEAAPLWHRPASYRLCARIWMEIGGASGAMSCLRRALDLDGDDLDSLNAMARIRRGRAPEAPAETGAAPVPDVPAPMEGEVLKRLEKAPEDLESLRGLIEMRRGQDRLQEAGALAGRFEAAVPAAPAWQQAAAYLLIARTWLELGDAKKARVLVLEAMEAGRGSNEAYSLFLRLEGLPRGAEAPELLEEGVRDQLFERRVSVAKARWALKDRAGAKEALERALALKPGDAGALGLLGQFMLEAGRPAEALAASDRLIAASRTAPRGERAAALLSKARLELELKDPRGAEEDLARALDADPLHAQALRELLTLKLAGGQAPEALALADRLIAASEKAPGPERADAFRRKSRVQRALKDEPGARRSLLRALASDPEDLATLGVLFEDERQRPAEALAVVEGHPPAGVGARAQWLVFRGLARILLNDEKAARVDFSEALRTDAQAACFSVPMPRDRLDRAYFEACVARFPGSPALRLDRGIALYKDGKAQAALADFRKAVSLKPDYAEAHLSLVSVLAGLGRRQEARAAADAALGGAGKRAGPVFDRLRALRASL